ncbi:MAG: YceD family protein [Clostridium sp.]
MIIQFSEIISRRERKKEISFEYEAKPFRFEGEIINPASKIEVNGQLISNEEVVVLELNIKADLELSCSRCLGTFIYPIDIDIEERFTNNIELQDEEVLFVKGDGIDITEVVESSIISTLPIKRLCNNNCKGLCQSCGSNLNHDECTCINDDVDVRLAGLKALLQNKEV